MSHSYFNNDQMLEITILNYVNVSDSCIARIITHETFELPSMFLSANESYLLHDDFWGDGPLK